MRSLFQAADVRSAWAGSGMGFLARNGERNGKSEVDGPEQEQVTPEDLLEFGFIPELVGRLPVAASLQSLDREALVRVLIEPKNAIVKQYQQLFRLDDVQLEFSNDALITAAERALAYQTGARVLRHIVEDALLDVMYELPSLTDIGRCVVHQDAINGDASPRLYRRRGGRYITLKTALAQSEAHQQRKSA